MQFAVFCLLGVSMVLASGYDDKCSLKPCGSNLGVYYLTLTRYGSPPAYEVVTFHTDGFFSGISSNQNAAFSSFEGTWQCTGYGNKAIQATDFLFNFANPAAYPPTPATLSKGVFNLQLSANSQSVSGTLNATSYDLVSTQNSNPTYWKQLSKIDFTVQGYKLLQNCNK